MTSTAMEDSFRFDQHFYEKDFVVQENVMMCCFCCEIFDSDENLRLHILNYLKNDNCKQSQESHESCLNLAVDDLVATPELPYVICQICGKTFGLMHKYHEHLEGHKEENMSLENEQAQSENDFHTKLFLPILDKIIN